MKAGAEVFTGSAAFDHLEGKGRESVLLMPLPNHMTWPQTSRSVKQTQTEVWALVLNVVTHFYAKIISRIILKKDVTVDRRFLAEGFH